MNPLSIIGSRSREWLELFNHSVLCGDAEEREFVTRSSSIWITRVSSESSDKPTAWEGEIFCSHLSNCHTIKAMRW
jgi:hypothetical protein